MDKIIAVAVGGSIGAFVIGLISATALKNTGFNKNLELFLKTGICGGFTTFSTFSLESFNLLQSGNHITSLLYIVLSVSLSLLAILLAYSLLK